MYRTGVFSLDSVSTNRNNSCYCLVIVLHKHINITFIFQANILYITVERQLMKNCNNFIYIVMIYDLLNHRTTDSALHHLRRVFLGYERVINAHAQKPLFYMLMCKLDKEMGITVKNGLLCTIFKFVYVCFYFPLSFYD